MRQTTKFFLSLTAAFVVFAALFYFAFFTVTAKRLRLFFYDRQALSSQLASLGEASSLMDQFHINTVQNFENLLDKPSFRSLFDLSSDYIKGDAQRRTALTRLITRHELSLYGLRIYSDNDKSFVFTSMETDAEKGHFSFADLNRQKEMVKPARLEQMRVTSATSTFKVYFGVSPAGHNVILYALPVYSPHNVLIGTAYAYVNPSSLYAYMLSQGVFVSAQTSQFIRGRGIVFNVSTADFAMLSSALTKFYSGQYKAGQLWAVGDSLHYKNGLYLIFLKDSKLGRVGKVLSGDTLLLSMPLQLTLYGVLSAVVFTLLFLIFNIHENKDERLRNRIRRFQLSFLQDYLKTKGNLDWRSWENELKMRKKVVVDQFTRDVKGKLGVHQQAELEGLIENTWDGLVELISQRQKPLEDQTRRSPFLLPMQAFTAAEEAEVEEVPEAVKTEESSPQDDYDKLHEAESELNLKPVLEDPLEVVLKDLKNS